ncbi:hypothetical protein BDY24DRAFT_339456 [Mrakia frigida]|uniref:Dsf2p n=1 Tax=Mrakia frigida TaxID=29902 RepID=UPI003FCBF318
MYFREAATIDGGCPGGMLFWGLTLRSGWGVVKDERKGFEWLRRACEPRPLGTGGEGGGGGRRGSDGGMGGGGETESAALAPEMVVAILEVAQCFLHGWGCAKDPEKAVNYLLVAAKMGDVDAQLQLASCYLHGLGTKGKKDKVQSAFWFRAAIAQGASDSGLSWVHKKKYVKEG